MIKLATYVAFNNYLNATFSGDKYWIGHVEITVLMDGYIICMAYIYLHCSGNRIAKPVFTMSKWSSNVNNLIYKSLSKDIQWHSFEFIIISFFTIYVTSPNKKTCMCAWRITALVVHYI